MAASRSADSQRLIRITLDEHGIKRRSREVEHEREVAIYDLLEANHFQPVGNFHGPYSLHLSVAENRLIFDLKDADEAPLTRIVLPLASFRRLIRDYFMVCESYFDAIKRAPRAQIEALDMGRRALHDEGSELLRERLKGKAEMDHETARRLFTLICVLHLRP